jgi:hypothetical protein
MNRVLGLAVLLAAAPPLWADVAPNPLTTGGTTLARKSAKPVPVTMAWEEVDLYPSPEKNRVEAVFLLKNTGRAAVELTVGFPSYYDVRLRDFAVTIDGKKHLAEVQKTGGTGPKRIFTYWLCWPMKFGPGAEHKVRVTYWCPTGRPTSVLVSRTPTSVTYKSVPRTLPDDLKAKLPPVGSGYVLRTGAGWHGTIGKATIRLHYGDAIKKEHATEVRPPDGWKYDPRTDTDTLILKDFKPDEKSDISYVFRLVSPRQEAALLLAALAKGRLDPASMAYLLELVEKENALKLDPAARGKRVVGLLEQMVPPRGPAYSPKKPEEFGGLTPDERFLRDAFRRLLSHYRDRKDRPAQVRLGRAYVEFLGFLVKRKRAYLDDPKTIAFFMGDKAYDVQRGLLAQIEREHDSAKKVLRDVDK